VLEELDEQRAGCPAISVPFGHTPDGLPIGIQLVAPHGADRFLLEAAAVVEILST
jgi:amidase